MEAFINCIQCLSKYSTLTLSLVLTHAAIASDGMEGEETGEETEVSTGIQHLPEEVRVHIFGYLSPKEIYQALLSNRKLRPAAEEALKYSLRKLQEEGPLKVTTVIPTAPHTGMTTLERLLKYKDVVTRVSLSGQRGHHLSRKVFEELGQFNRLRELWLNGSVGSANFADFQCLPDSLQVLIVGGNTFPNNQSLMYMANACPHLEVLGIREAQEVTDSGLKSLVNACSELLMLDVSHPENITVYDLGSLKRVHPGLIIRNPFGNTLEEMTTLLPYREYISRITLSSDEADPIVDSKVLEDLTQFPHLESISITLQKPSVNDVIPELAIEGMIRSLVALPNNPQIRIILGDGYSRENLRTVKEALSEITAGHTNLRIEERYVPEYRPRGHIRTPSTEAPTPRFLHE